MTGKQNIRRQWPPVTEVVKGEPIRVGERELVPEVRATTYVRRKVFVGADRVAGGGVGFVYLRPVAILERSAAGERRIPIQDRTVQMLGGMLLAAIIAPPLLAIAARLVRRISK